MSLRSGSEERRREMQCLKWVDLSQKEVCDRHRYVFVNDDV